MKEVELREEKTVGEGVGFERIRRITGYLVGTVDRFNNGKKAEEKDRVKQNSVEKAKTLAIKNMEALTKTK